ncbi:hypothetical protein FOL47_004194 [Perkinsus chesapeaki]|uniref:subtilisin n=1 Tax=Perkinsus chesapeaki TaxID=330153 RepID=A0A7J6MZ90_PERCH|nr:hypothetical protein FOL47_004194 [Perkinsus chesapeaki]
MFYTLLSLLLAISIRMTASTLVDPDDEYYKSKQKSYLDAIELADAWRTIIERGYRVRSSVAIIGFGINYIHPDLDETASDGYDVVTKGGCEEDRDGNGTPLAGIIGATIDNEIGIAGVTEAIDLMPICIDSYLNDPHVAAAINYAVDKNFGVILYPSARYGPFSSDVVAALKRASNANISIVCPAGDDGKDISAAGEQVYPCKYTDDIDGVICVTGTYRDIMLLSDDSNYAPYVDIAAPMEVFTTTVSNGYGVAKGTPYSAALVAGIVALMKTSSVGTLTAEKVKYILQQSSDLGVTSDEGLTMQFGRVNVLEAIKMVIKGVSNAPI